MSDRPMRKFLKRRHAMKKEYFSPRHKDNSDEVSDEESQASGKFHYTGATTDKTKFHVYNESYFSMGFTRTGDSSCPLCFICGKRLTNSAMASPKLK
jgi:hypothetical protein